MRGFGFVLASAFMLTGMTAAQASDADFSLRNKTGYQIDEVYVSGHSSKSWGRDIMGRVTRLATARRSRSHFPTAASPVASTSR